jgi:succinate dehydrogenase/fumarate reductase flavoprotein subunit
MSDLDVLVVGSGIAGLSAAVSAAEAGAERVLVAEAEDVVGGSSRLSSGIILGGCSRRQAAAGHQDSPDAFYLDYMNLNHWDLRGDVARSFTSRSGPTLDWLEDLGVEFYPEPVFGGAENVPRCLAAKHHGQGVVDVLAHTARRHGVDIAVGLRVDRLLVENGAVTGAAVDGDEIRADAVVLATGGFGANPAKLDELFPSTRTAGSWLWYIGAAGARGDGIDLGRQAGASVVGHDRGLRLLHPNFARNLESYLPGWQVLVDGSGRRFVDESAPYGVLNRVVHLHGDTAFAVFDHQAVDVSTATRTDAYVHEVPGREAHRTPNWNPVMVADMVREGRIVEATTVSGLAKGLGLPADRLETTVRLYNGGAARGVDGQGKDARFLRALDRPPFYGAELRLATIASTWTGLEIDGRAQVLDPTGTPVPGLYAAGETTGGVLAWVYAGDGNNLGNAATFGRTAGQSAASRPHVGGR